MAPPTGDPGGPCPGGGLDEPPQSGSSGGSGSGSGSGSGASETPSRFAAPVYALFLVFGIGSWATVNALFTELPLLVSVAPEGWRLASVLALAVQLANVGPLLFCGLRRLARRRPGGEDALATAATYLVLAVGALAMFGLAATWSVTVDIGGTGHSGPLLCFAFLAAMADCTSSLVFWRFAAGFRAVHVSALATGEGLSGVVAAGLSWIQNASGKEPNFTPTVYFGAVGAVMWCCLGAFHALRTLRCAREERRCAARETAAPDESNSSPGCCLHGFFAALVPRPSTASGWAPGAAAVVGRTQGTGAGSSSSESECAACAEDNSGAQILVPSGSDSPGQPRRREVIGLLLTQAWLNVLQNGISVSCLSLAAKPYGQKAYQWAQTVSLLVDPVVAGVGFRIPAPAGGLVPVVAVATAMYAYVLALSLAGVQAPLPPLPGQTGGGPGGAVLVGVVTVGRALISYAKMRANVLLQRGAPKEAETRLMHSGVAMQCGAFSGSLAMYGLINHTDLFRSA